MTNFAVIENGIVENIIVAESLEIAQSASGKTCVEYQDGSNAAYIGLTYKDGVFEQPPAPTWDAGEPLSARLPEGK
jgi:hypothetical protein